MITKWYNFRYKQNKLLILIIGIASIVGGFTYFFPLPTNRNDILYLLSSISQGLAAIFALVFAITIFGAQMTKNYAVLDKLIDNYAKTLMVIFSIGIILPLLILRIDVDLLKINFINTPNLSLAFVLSIATFCVLSIIPYSIRINKIIKYHSGIPKLYEEIYMAIDSSYEVTASNRTTELMQLVETGLKDLSQQELLKIIDEMGDIGTKFADNAWKDATLKHIAGMKNIGLKSVEEKFDKDIEYRSESFISGKIIALSSPIKSILYELQVIGIKAADKELIDVNIPVAIQAIDGLLKIGESAIDYNFQNDNFLLSSRGMLNIGVKMTERRLGFFGHSSMGINMVLECMIKISDRAYHKNKNKFSSDESMIYLWVLGAFVNKNCSKYSEEFVQNLKLSNALVIEDLFGSKDIRKKSKEYIKNNYTELEEEIEKFEKIYDKTE